MKVIRRKAARGQALVEAALGVTLFVTILLLGIHFAEVGWLSLKATEATANALFDSTSQRIQVPGVPADAAQRHAAVLQAAPGAALARYSDFDGRSSANGGTTLATALTSAQGMQVQCETGGGGVLLTFAPSAAAEPAYADVGDVSCVAGARIDAPGLPRAFLSGGETSLFKEEQRGALNMQVCGIGRATNGTCSGRVGILVNDWALAGEAGGEAADCRLATCAGGNTVFRDAVDAVFRGQGAGAFTAGAQMAQTLTGTSPTSAANFHMSYAGHAEQNPYQDGLPGHTAETGPYNTGGPGAGVLANHPLTAAECFLGMPGCQ